MTTQWNLLKVQIKPAVSTVDRWERFSHHQTENQLNDTQVIFNEDNVIQLTKKINIANFCDRQLFKNVVHNQKTVNKKVKFQKNMRLNASHNATLPVSQCPTETTLFAVRWNMKEPKEMNIIDILCMT